MLLPAPQNETADIGFFRTIGLAFIMLTAIAGFMTFSLILKQNDTSAHITIVSTSIPPFFAVSAN